MSLSDTTGTSDGYHPSKAEIQELLTQASNHPLGTDFLLKGALDAVAATFHAHAFCVDAARDALRSRASEGEPIAAQRAAVLR